MGKHVFTRVECFGCNKPFKTEKLKHEYEEYTCPHCKHVHWAELNEVDQTWIHQPKPAEED